MNPSICAAIRNRAVIAFNYNGKPRIVEPHCHGLSVAGKELIRGYQVGETPQDGQYWRLFDVARMSDLIVLPTHFPTPRPGFRADDQKMSEVHCHV